MLFTQIARDTSDRHLAPDIQHRVVDGGEQLRRQGGRVEIAPCEGGANGLAGIEQIAMLSL